MKAGAPFLLTPKGPPTGKGGLFSLKVTRMMSRACPPRGVWAGLLPHLLPSSIVLEAKGGGFLRGGPQLSRVAAGCTREATGPEGAVGLPLGCLSSPLPYKRVS